LDLRGFSKWALALADGADTDLLAFDFGVLAGGDDLDFRVLVSMVLSLEDADFAFKDFDFEAGEDFVAACTFDFFFLDPVVFVVFSLGCFVFLLTGTSLLSFDFFLFFLLLTFPGNNRTPITCSTVEIKLFNDLSMTGDCSAILKQDRIKLRSFRTIGPASLESTSTDLVAPPRTDRVSSRLLVGDAECDEEIIEDDED
jgi:hypothetical protein